MPTKTNGAEWIRFYKDPAIWGPAGWSTYYHEDMTIWVDGIAHHDGDDDDVSLDEIPPEAKVIIECGVLRYQGDERLPERLRIYDLANVETVFRKWRKAQRITSLVIEVPHENLDAVKAAVTAAGGKILG
jgi:hypothetical protein